MEKAGRIVEAIVKYLDEEKSVRREDIKDKFDLEEEKVEAILKLLLDLELLVQMNNEIRITESGREFLQL